MATRNFNIDDTLHLRFKIKCTEKKTDMSKEVRKFIEGFVGDDIPGKPEKDTIQETSNNLNF